MTQSIRSIEQLNRLSPSERRALLKDAVRRTKESPESSAGPKICPTSFAQQRLWFLDRLMGESRFYNIANAVRIAGQINVIALEGGANEIVQRHEALRTSFALIDGTPAQVVARSLNIRLPLVDLSGLSADEIDGEVKRLAMEQIARPFDLSRLPLIRISLLHTAVNEHVAVMTMHHIISDGWSMTVLIRELGSLYHGIVNGEPSRLRALRAQYSDFARWQRIHCAGPASEDHLRYWRERLKGLTPLDLLADRPRPPALTHRGATRTVVFSEDLSRSLRTIGRTRGVTLFMTLLAGLHLLLSRYTAQPDTAIGSQVAGRDKAEFEELIGFFINMVVLRCDLSEDRNFLDLLQEVRGTTLEAYQHQDVPFEQVVQELQPERDLSRQPLVQASFSFENIPQEELVLADLTIEPQGFDPGTTRFDIELHAQDRGRQIVIALLYNTDLFDDATSIRMLGHFETLIQDAIARPRNKVSSLSMLGPIESHQVLIEWNSSAADSHSKCLYELFEDQVKNSPDATAVVYENQQLSYAQLDKRAGQLASRLLRLGAGPDTIVGVCLHRSVDLPVGLIGILKAGASYLPLDPEYPPDRLRFMLGDADVAVVLSDSSLIDSLPGGPAHVITPEAPSAVYRECPRGPAVKDNLAYVMYTSGSTGAPKAAMNSHGAIVNRLSWMQNQYRLSADDRVLQKTPFSFDVSVWEFFWPLLNGVCLVIAEPGGHRDRQYLFDLIKCEQITTLHFVPSMLRVMLEDNSLRRCYSLRQVFCSGEELPVDLRDRFLSTASAGLHNLYGPTEAAVDATFSACQSGNNLWRVPIGRPVANTSIRLLDRSLNVAAIGIAGELHIGGAQVGRGYLGRPDLTAERFTPDPLPELPGARLYKTGDIARYLSDGQLEFLGRVDYQVKIRGHRIELQEIENALKQHSDVREAAVVVRQETGNQKRLVAYVVASPQTDRAELRTFAAERLPGYMVPSAFLLMNALPLTVSGKLDRRALPAPEDTNEVSAKKYEPPSNSPEQVLCRIWSEVLRLKRVGVHDNFFALGGDSIISIQIIDRANREGLRLTPRQLFKHQTVAELAAVAGTVTTFQEQGPVVGDVSLTPIQKRFFESLPLNPNHYNQAVLLKTKQRLDPLLLGQAVSILVEHHDALRLRFIQDRVGWRQFSVGVSEAPVGSVPSVDLSGVPSPEQAAQMARCAGALHESLDLRAGPVVRAAHFSLGDGGFDRFLLIVHHLAVDGVSWRILLQDLGSIYGRLLQGTAISLPAKTTSYKRWSEELSGLANSSRLFGELDYWTADGRTDFGRLPLDDTSGPNSLAAARSVSFQLSEANTKSLLSLLPGKYRATLSDALAAALAAALSAWTGSNRVLIDFEGHGREELLGSADLSRTVGWFTSIFPVLLLVPDSQDPTDLIKSIKEQLRSVPNWGAGYAALRYLSREPSVSGRLARASENETILNYLGQFDQALGGSDLFEFAEEPSGLAQNINEKREYLLEVTGFVNNDRLNVSVTYCSNLHRKETIQRLSAAIESRLDRLAERCLTAPSAFTPSDFPLISLNQHRLDQLASRFRDIEDLYPTSPLQQGLLFHVLYSTAADLYLNQLSYWIQGALDTSAFKEAWSRVSSRHAIWRTAFVWEDLEQPLQVVLKAAALGFEELDWRGMPSEEQERSFELLLNKDRLLPFDLMKPPLARLTLVRLSHDAFQFVWTHHHLISDGWSAVILLKDILLCYEALRVGKEPVLPRPRPYRDYIAWLGEQSLAEAEFYWSRTLKGFASSTPLPVARLMADPETAQPSSETENLRAWRLQASTVRGFASRNRLTVNTIVQGAWALLLGLYCDEQDVTFGATTAGRPAELDGVESMVGVFINSLPVRVALPPSMRVTDWLGDLQDRQAEQRQYEYSPLIQIQKWSSLPQKQPLFNTLLVFENYPTDEHLGRASFKVMGIRVREKTHYPLTLTASLSDSLLLQLAFDTARIERHNAKRLLDHLQNLIENIIAQPVARLGQLNALSEQERRQLLLEQSGAPADYRIDCVHHLFEAQVRRRPDSVAITLDSAMMTYRAVNSRANAIAGQLTHLGIARGDRVAIRLERSVEMVAALLGVLKAGAAYVPADLSYPEERLRYVLDDSDARVLITKAGLVTGTALTGAVLFFLDEPGKKDQDRGDPEQNAAPSVDPADVFSVYYTSGSTGTPKGVLESHSEFINRFNWMWEKYPFATREVCCQKTALGFVDSIWEIFGPLLAGIRVVVIPDSAVREASRLAALIHDEKISRIVLAPSLLSTILDLDPFPARELVSLKYCFSSGEELPLDIARQFKARLPYCTLINLYGSSEIGADVTWYEVNEDLSARVLIGLPISNVQAYVLDTQLRPAPSGVPAMIYCGGAQVADGYLNRSDLTASRFLPDPFSDTIGARFYETGDRGRFVPEGGIEYLGRTDHQVKIRGFRIELGEIESVLLQHEYVRAAAVTLQEGDPGGPRLIAHLVAESGREPSMAELRKFLSTKLPGYTLPSAIVLLEALPLTVSGKIDRRSLREPPHPSSVGLSRNPEAPVIGLLAGVWEQLLKVEHVGPNENFFDLGGHSLLATQLRSRIRTVFDVELPLSCIFDSPTLEAMGDAVEAALRSNSGLEYSPIEPAQPRDRVPLSFAQERLWIFDRLNPGSISQNLPIAVRLSGALDVAALESTLERLATRHESLRTSFAVDDGQPLQRIASVPAVDLIVADLSGLVEGLRQFESQGLLRQFAARPFDLAQAPLWRVLLLRLAQFEHIVLLTMHHIISDAWSLGVLVSELMRLYSTPRAEPSALLPPLPVQYPDFATWQRGWLQGNVLEKQLSYWSRQLAGAPPLLALPADRPRPPVQTDRGATETAILNTELTNALRALCRAEGSTMFMTLMAAFQILMRRYSGQEDIVIGSPVSGRTRTELEGLIGFFINPVAIRTRLSGNPAFGDVLKQVRATALSAYAHQDLPFNLVVDAVHPPRRNDQAPVFQVVLNFQNAPATEMSLPGLTISAVPVDIGTTKYDLTLYLKEYSGSIGLSMVYNIDLFDRATIRRMLRHFQEMLSAVASDSNARLDALLAATPGDSVMIDSERKKANIESLMNTRRRGLNLSGTALVKSGNLGDGTPLPLLVTPTTRGVDLAGWAASNVEFIETQLMRRGAILFRGFVLDSAAAFERFARYVTPELVNYVEGSSPRLRLADKVYTSTEYPPEYFISLHNELSYAHKWPGRLFFYCNLAPPQGGETPIADSREVLRLLNPEIVEKFDRKGVRYVRRLHGDRGAGLSWQNVFETTDRDFVEAYCREGSIEFEWGEDGSLRTSQIRPALATHPRTGERVWFNQADQWHWSNLGPEISMALRSGSGEDHLPIAAYYGDGSPIELEALDQIRAAFKQLAVKFPWAEGDILLIDNMLVAHGRMPYTGPRKVLVAMGSPVTAILSV